MVELFETKETHKLGYDALVFSSNDDIKKYKIGVGAKFSVDFTGKNEEPVIDKVIKESEKYGKFPTNCPSCGGNIVNNFCTNKYCGSQMRGSLYTLLKIVSPSTDEKVFTEFLNGYLLSSNAFVSIDTIGEFLEIFKSVVAKNTLTRMKQWNNDYLFQLDVAVDNYLRKNKELNREVFWKVLNLPKIDFKDVRHLIPTDIIKQDLRAFSKLNAFTRGVISNNIDYVEFLFNFFNNFGIKKWN